MGRTVAVPPALVIAKRIRIVRDLKNSTGNMRREVVVNIVKTCCKPRRIKRTPEQMNMPMIFPEFHG